MYGQKNHCFQKKRLNVARHLYATNTIKLRKQTNGNVIPYEKRYIAYVPNKSREILQKAKFMDDNMDTVVATGQIHF